MLAKAEALQEQARQLRAEAQRQAKEEARKARERERNRIQREAVALITFAKKVPLTVNGSKVSVYDFLVAEHERSKQDGDAM